MLTAINFFGSSLFIIVSGVVTIISIGLMIPALPYTMFLAVKGFFPVWYRLGIGLSKSKIAVFASTEEFNSLKDMLVDSKIFKSKNIMQINKSDMKKADKANIFLVHWKEFETEIPRIIKELKKDSTALIVYAPTHEGRINNEEILTKINNERNSLIVNFRGRLMNDILTSLITANYGR